LSAQSLKDARKLETFFDAIKMYVISGDEEAVQVI